jgi:hypothetical protein
MKRSKKQPMPKIEPDLIPFSGRLAALRIQPALQKDLLKYEIKSDSNSSPISIIKKEPTKMSEIDTHACDVKPKLEPFTGNVQSLSIRPVELQDIKPLRRQKKFTCDMCQNGVGTKGGLLYHIKAHLNGRPFKCKICKRSYATKNDFDTHNKRHAGRVTCDYCNKYFSVKQYLADHISALHLPKNLKCHLCKKEKYFSSAKALRLHKNACHFLTIHGQSTGYYCKLCGYRTVSKKLIKLHKLKATKMNHQCKICLQKFSCLKLLSKHIQKEQKTLVKCQMCKGEFKKIRYHIENVHKNVKCDFCDFKTHNLSFFAIHIKKCATQDMLRSKGHLCIECDTYCFSERSLKNHISSKHGTCFCSICPARFKTKRAFNRHTRKHKTNPIRCLCPKFPMFANMQAFNAHFNSSHKFGRASTTKMYPTFYGRCLFCIEHKVPNKHSKLWRSKYWLKSHIITCHLNKRSKKLLSA